MSGPLLRKTRTGSIRIDVDEAASIFIVTASGHVGPRLVRWDLEAARTFGLSRPEGWWYIVDTAAVRLPNPLNVPLLRRIRGLPHLSGYVVVAPNPVLRLIARALSAVSRPDAVTATVDEALRVARSHTDT